MKKVLLKSVMAALAVLLSLNAQAQHVEIDGIHYILGWDKTAAVTYQGTSYSSNAYSGSVVIPASIVNEGTTYAVKSIGESAFRGCSGLTDVSIPNSVTSIGNYAFYGCSGLTDVNIPNSVKSIGSDAFYECSGLTAVDIPNSVTDISNNAFRGCSSLTTITVASDNPKYDSRNCNAIILTSYDYLVAGCKKTTIPNSVKSIGTGAFDGCSGLTTISIPNSVTAICQDAFLECSGLTAVDIGSSVTVIDIGAFEDCSSLSTISIPSSVTSIGEWAFSGCSSLSTISIPSSVTSIGMYAFSGCSGMTAVTIPNSITSINNYTFRNCSGLTTVDIPNSVTSIGNYAFGGCKGLTTVDIPNSVTSIGANAFMGCIGLTAVDIPNSVTSIGSSAFGSCKGLISVTIPNSITSIDYDAFSSCSSLTTVTCYAENVPTTKSDAFQYSPISSATLYVPQPSIEAYRTTSPWSGFGTINRIPGANYEMTVTVSDLRGTVTYDETNITNGTETFDVEEGSDIMLTLTPRSEDYQLKSVTVNEVDMTASVVNGQLTIANISGDQNVEVEFEVAGTTVTATIGASGYATFCSLENLDFTTVSGIKAYIVSAFRPNTGDVTITRIYDVPAETGLLLKGSQGTYEIPLGEGETIVSNMLRGVNVATTLSKEEGDYTNYILANGKNGIGFYAVVDNSVLGAGKAYLPLPTASVSSLPEARGISLVLNDEDEDATSIHDMEESRENNAVYYNLNGQRVEAPTRGIYIKNGKKVFVK